MIGEVEGRASTHGGRPSPGRDMYSSCRNRGTRRSRAAITSRTARAGQAAVQDGQRVDLLRPDLIGPQHALVFVGQPVHRPHPWFPGQHQAPSGSGPGTFALPARAGSLFSQPGQCNVGFGANATEMPFWAPPTDRTEAIVPVQIGGSRA